MNFFFKSLLLGICLSTCLFSLNGKTPVPHPVLRMPQSESVIAQSDVLAPIDSVLFQLALGLMLTENYGQAEDCFRKLVQQHPRSLEVRNNQAINLALWAMSLLDEEEATEIIQYVFPFEVSYLSITQKGNEDNSFRKEQITRLMRKAIAGFEACRDWDKKAASIRLNLASAYAILGRLEKDKSLLRKSLEEAKQAASLAKEQGLVSTQGYAVVVEGILYAYLRDDATRDAKFAQAREVYRVQVDEQLGRFIQKNLAVAEQDADWEPVRTAAEKYDPFLDEPEKVDGIALARLGSLPVDKEAYALEVAKVYEKAYSASHLYVYFKDVNNYMMFHQTASDYSGTTSRKIKIRDSEARVREQYGDPYCEQAAVGGKLILYKNPKLMFFIGPDEKVQHWTIWFGKKSQKP